MEEENLDRAVITSRDNTFIFLLFRISSILIFTRDKAYFAADFRYIEAPN